VIIILLLISSKLLEKFYVPSFLAMLLVGILLGPQSLNFVDWFLKTVGRTDKITEVHYVIEAFGYLGLTFLMALIGMEIKPELMKREKKSIIMFSIFTVVIPTVAALIAAMIINLDYVGYILLASIFVSHAVGIVFMTFKDLQLEKSKFGIAVIGASMAATIFQMVFLSIAAELQGQRLMASGVRTLSVLSKLYSGSNQVILSAVILIALAVYFIVSLLYAPRLIHYAASHFKNVILHAPLFFLLIILVFMMIGEAMGINAVVGAFVAGMVISISGILEKYEDMDKVLTQIGYGIFVPMMFYYLGSQTRIQSILEVKNLAILLLIFVLMTIAKLGSGYLALQKLGYKKLESIFGGLMTVPRLGTTLIAANLGKAMNIINEEVYTSIVIVAIITTLPVPIILKFLAEKFNMKFHLLEPVAAPEVEIDKLVI
jgi:Kef-type K+ transport system membrane component KefB